MSWKLSSFAACVLAAGAVAAAGERRAAEFSADAGVGRMDGTSYERVYTLIDRGALDGRYHRLSELVWDLEAVYGARVSLALDVERAVELRATFFSAFMDGTGGMEDYDWFLYDRPDYWTHRSRSTVDVKKAFDIDLRGTVHVVRDPRLSLDAMMGWRYLNFKWEDNGVDYVYSSMEHATLSDIGSEVGGYSYEFNPDTIRDQSGTIIGVGITYEQEYHIPYIGLGVKSKLGKVDLKAEARYSPMVTALDKDEHVIRQLVFKGTFTGGTYFSWKCSAAYRFSGPFFVSASYESQKINEIRGDMQVSDMAGNSRGTLHEGASVELESRQVAIAVGMDFR